MARDFNGTDGRLSIDQVPMTAAPLTVSAWVNADIDTARLVVFYLGDKDLSNELWWLALEGNDTGDPVVWRCRGASSPREAITSTGFSTGTWHHICGIEASATDRRCFIDGGSKGTNTTSDSPTGVDRTTIGRNGGTGTKHYFDGRIAHLAIWDVALTDAEVASLAAGVSPLRLRRDNLVCYLPVGGQSPERDIIGGLNMTLTGTAPVAEEPPIPRSIIAPG